MKLAVSVALDEPMVRVVVADVELPKVAPPVTDQPAKTYPELGVAVRLTVPDTTEPEDTELPLFVTEIVPPVGFDQERVALAAAAVPQIWMFGRVPASV